MEKPMRLKKRQLTDDNAKQILRDGTYGTLSTISIDNTPYNTPLNYVYYDNAIFFHCANEGHKLDNIRNNNAVCFSVVNQAVVIPEELTTKYQSIIVNGSAEILDISENYAPLKALIQKYCGEFNCKSDEEIEKFSGKTMVVRVNIFSITGKSNKF